MGNYYILYKKSETEDFRIFGGGAEPKEINTYNHFRNAYHAVQELRKMGYIAKLKKVN